MTITLDAAQAIIERARAHATSIDVPMNIAVTDGGGHLLAFGVQAGRLAEHWDIWEREATKAESLSGLPMLGDRFPDERLPAMGMASSHRREPLASEYEERHHKSELSQEGGRDEHWDRRGRQHGKVDRCAARHDG
jgi:hypothetical protein